MDVREWKAAFLGADVVKTEKLRVVDGIFASSSLQRNVVQVTSVGGLIVDGSRYSIPCDGSGKGSEVSKIVQVNLRTGWVNEINVFCTSAGGTLLAVW